MLGETPAFQPFPQHSLTLLPLSSPFHTALLPQSKNYLQCLVEANNVSSFRFVSSFDRPNLSYSVRPKNRNTILEIVELIKKKYPYKSGIIYGFSRKVRNTVFRGNFNSKMFINQ